MPDKHHLTHAVNLRVRHDIRRLIDRAAKAQGKTRSDFMIDTAPTLSATEKQYG